MTRDEIKAWAEAHPNMPQAVAVLQLLQYCKDLEHCSGLKGFEPERRKTESSQVGTDPALSVLQLQIKLIREAIKQYLPLCPLMTGPKMINLPGGDLEEQDKLFGSRPGTFADANKHIPLAITPDGRVIRDGETVHPEQGCSTKPDTTSESPASGSPT